MLDRFRPLGASGALCLLGLAVSACGHPASRGECEEIFARSAEIELRSQAITDAAVIAERTAAAHEAKGEAIIDQCVGKRITDSAMACVRSAKTGDEMDGCLQ